MDPTPRSETFRRVTLPLIMPGVFAVLLLGFALASTIS